MTETAFFIELVKNLGFPVLIFIIWYLYHRSSMKLFEQIIAEQSEESKRNYQTLKEMVDTNQCTLAILARIEQKIDNSVWCPYVKERMRSEVK